MQTTTPPKRTAKGFAFTVQAPKRENLFPIAVQIQLKAMERRHDKSRSRAKQKRAWKQD